MIQERRGGRTECMTQRESFDEYYTKKLEAIVIELKAVIKCGIPFATNAVYACTKCQGRIKVYADEKLYCLRCDVPKSWTRDLQAYVSQILQSYPCYEESVKEWESLQVEHKRQLTGKGTPKDGDEELGKKIREARERLGWTREELARKIQSRQSGGRLSKSSIQGYENAHARPSKGVLEQLEQLLELKG